MRVRSLDVNAAVPVLGELATAPLVLRAALGGEALTDDQRTDMLTRSRAGEHFELHVDIEAFNQRDGERNRNNVRFRKGALSALGKSGAGTVFLRDHNQSSLDARGGTISRSKMEKIDGGHVLRQTVHAFEPWAVQGFLSGAIDRFSIGWHPTGEILCSACKADVRECYHWPGDKLDQGGDEHVVEFIFQSAELVETSAVVVPAVKGTGVDNIRAALGLSTISRSEERMEEHQTDTGASGASEKEIEAAKLAATQAERARSSEIRRTGEALKLSGEFVQEHLAKGTGADAFRKLAIEKHADANPSPILDHGRPTVEAGKTDSEKFRAGLTSALLQRMGGQIRAGLDKMGHSLENGDQFRSFSVLDMARECLRRANISTHGKTRMQILGIANTLSSGYQATGDFSVAFEEAIHKALQARMQLQEMTWRRFCRVGRLNDFRPHRRYRIGEMGVWEVVLENGEYKRIEIPDAVRETISAKKHGNMIAWTREAQINDDMGFVEEQINAFVDGGLYTVERAVYDFLALNGGLGGNLADGKPLFDASRKNITTGAALSVAALDADRVAMKRQRDDNDQRFLNLRPRTLVIATELFGTARVINNNEFDPDPVAVGATNNNQVTNKVRNLFADIVDAPELTGTRRYILADPMIVPAIEVAFLEGVETPTVETRDGWTVDGVEMKGRYEFGVAGRDGRGAITNAGA